jgi:hypothetical protein
MEPDATFLPITEMAGQTLEMDPKSEEWHQVQLTVNRGTEPVARFLGRTGTRMRGIEAHAKEGGWILDQHPSLEWEIYLISMPSGAHLATFEVDLSNFRGEGFLTFTDGRRFHWRSGGGAAYEMINTRDGGRLYSAALVRRAGMMIPGTGGNDCSITLDADAARHAELPSLTLFGFYMLWRLQAKQWERRRERRSMFDDD